MERLIRYFSQPFVILCIAFFFVVGNNCNRREVIKQNVEWKVDQKSGKVSFVWKD